MWSLRTRLVHGFVAALGVTGLVSTAVGTYLIARGLTAEALDDARLDLNSARLVYDRAVTRVRHGLELAALDRDLDASRGAPDVLGPELEALRRRAGLDFLDLADATGRVLVRAQRPGPSSDSLADDPVVRRVLGGEDVFVATEIMEPEALERESPLLAARAAIPLRDATGAGAAVVEHRGLAIVAAAVVRHGHGSRGSLLFGGVLLNGDARLVDELRHTIYEGETLHGRPVGEGTLCLGPVRVATNLLDGQGQRALGTVVDPAVRDRVLGEGRPRVAHASVLGESHITAYDPIRDAAGRPIGILSLGIPARKFTEVRQDTVVTFLVLTLGGLALAFVVGGFISGRLTRPLASLVAGVQDVGRGDLGRRIEPAHVARELDALAEGFNAMAASLEERELQLRYRTEEQLGKAERLAMIGRLAAGVAHEINNPLGGIMLFSSLLLRGAPQGSAERENLERVAGEAKRCQRIVQGLLEFARRKEPRLEVQDVHPVIEKTLALVVSQPLFHNIEIVRAFDLACPTPRIDAAQIQQVLLNLVVNAAEAMEGRGRLTITTRAADGGGAVQVDVADTGRGISDENLDQLFEPFFTTKEVGHGTGLGLSISRGIVENHGGTIWAQSRVGAGTTFSVRLPAAARAA